jgi:lipoate-protein ligase A
MFPSCQIIPFSLASSLSESAPMRSDQKAYDAVENDYTVRFYTWPTPTVSLGRFQTPDPGLLKRLKMQGIPWVRRPTGGQAILHQGDLTFSIVGPLTAGQQHHLLRTYHHIAEGLIAGLARLNISAETVSHLPGDAQVNTRPEACYGFTSQADLRVNGKKLIGCAQVRRRSAFLQQGVVYLQAPHTLHQTLFKEDVSLVDLEGLSGQTLTPETVAEALGQGLKQQLEHRASEF